jgi:hypothetical protein
MTWYYNKCEITKSPHAEFYKRERAFIIYCAIFINF